MAEESERHSVGLQKYRQAQRCASKVEMKISIVSLQILKQLIKDKDNHLSCKERKNADLADSITAGICSQLIPQAQTS